MMPCRPLTLQVRLRRRRLNHLSRQVCTRPTRVAQQDHHQQVDVDMNFGIHVDVILNTRILVRKGVACRCLLVCTMLVSRVWVVVVEDEKKRKEQK